MVNWRRIAKAALPIVSEVIRSYRSSRPQSDSLVDSAISTLSQIVSERGERTTRDYHRSPRRRAHSAPPSAQGHDYPGDYHGLPPMEYRPQADDRAQPGEVIWTWVPFEEDHSQGKDRPVLVICELSDGTLLGLPLTSKDHDRDKAQENATGRYWMNLGPGAWDRDHRESEVRLDRVIQIDPTTIRRISVSIDQDLFNRVADGVRRHWND